MKVSGTVCTLMVPPNTRGSVVLTAAGGPRVGHWDVGSGSSGTAVQRRDALWEQRWGILHWDTELCQPHVPRRALLLSGMG